MLVGWLVKAAVPGGIVAAVLGVSNRADEAFRQGHEEYSLVRQVPDEGPITAGSLVEIDGQQMVRVE